MRICFIFHFFTDTQLHIVSDDGLLCNDGLVQFTAIPDHSSVHNNGIPYHRILTNGYPTTNHGVVNLSADLTSLTDNTSLYQTGLCEILWRKNLTLGIDLPVLFIKIKFRNDIDQFHIGFPIRIQRSYILPVAIKFKSIKW